jgi:hypothetical protein
LLLGMMMMMIPAAAATVVVLVMHIVIKNIYAYCLKYIV